MENENTNIIKLHNARVAQAARNQYVSQVRYAIVCAVVCTAISAVISFTFGAPVIPDNVFPKTILIPACSYCLLGILFVAFVDLKLSFLDKVNDSGILLYSFAVFVCVLLAAFAAGHAKGSISMLTCIYYSCLFLLPSVIYQAWLFYKNLSLTSYRKVWYLPEQTGQVPSATVFLNSIRIKIKVAPAHGTTEEIFETTVPGRMSVGNMFDNFINEEMTSGNSKFKDVHHQSFGWLFFAPSFIGMGTRLLHAEQSLDQNKIKTNTLITARRITKKLSITPIQNQTISN